jgi:hypothetical protein
VRPVRIAAIACATAVVTLGAVAYVRAADEQSGYAGKGQIVVQTTIGSIGKLTIGGDIAMEERGSQLRLDILSLGIPGTSQALNTLIATQFFPPGGFTIVYNRDTSTYVVWSNSRERYYSNEPTASATPGPQPIGPVAGAVIAGGDLFSAFSITRSLKDDSAFTVNLALAGHQTVNGHPATGLNFEYSRTTKSGDTLELHGTFQFADDLDSVPVEITAAGHSRSIPESAFRIDLSTLAKQAPPDADFAVPPSYVRVNNLGDVIGKTLPGM